MFNINSVVVHITLIFSAIPGHRIDSATSHELFGNISRKQDPLDYSFSNLLGVHNDTSFDVEDWLNSSIDRYPKNTLDSENIITHLNNQSILKQLEDLTGYIQNFSPILIQLNNEMKELKGNISGVSRRLDHERNEGEGMSDKLKEMSAVLYRVYHELRKELSTMSSGIERERNELLEMKTEIQGLERNIILSTENQLKIQNFSLVLAAINDVTSTLKNDVSKVSNSLDQEKNNLLNALEHEKKESMKIQNELEGLRRNVLLLTENQKKDISSVSATMTNDNKRFNDNLSAVSNRLDHEMNERKEMNDKLRDSVSTISNRLYNDLKNDLSNKIEQERQESVRLRNEIEGLKRNLLQLSEKQTSFQEVIKKNRYFQKTDSSIPRDCKEARERDFSGVRTTDMYEIQPDKSRNPFYVLCDMHTRGGGWTHIQKRIDGTQDFFLGWQDYKIGFGSLSSEFWLGLENIHSLTSANSELLIEFIRSDHKRLYAHYTDFRIGSESEGYNLGHPRFLGGDIDESLNYHAGRKFSTKDNDQDGSSENCAVTNHGGWWYNDCIRSHLNGKWGETAWYKHWAPGFLGNAQKRMLVRRI